MRRGFIFLLCAMFMFSSAFSLMATDMPDSGSDDGSGPYTDSDPAPDSGPDSTDSGDSWDSGSSGGDSGGVLF
ncbi:MAG: hypothetical protein KKB51_01175 [Candidatus Riflebacteria bacterium]|nr:hypothetical protein [Candidatus Riflebacteria bacterium]